MGMRQEVRPSAGQIIEIAGNSPEGFSAEEPAGGHLGQPGRAQMLRQFRSRRVDRARMVDGPIALAATGLVITGNSGDRFDQGGLAGAILAQDDGHRRRELHVPARITQERQGERVLFWASACRSGPADAPEIGRAKGGLRFSVPAHATLLLHDDPHAQPARPARVRTRPIRQPLFSPPRHGTFHAHARRWSMRGG